ncbi:MAG: hypothetical protein CMK29_08330 [Porticoccaceae bacterium]|nr:hypothetical protein [Porticoccaceae bacterium]|tara:strand:+ start:1024 stop:1497 length:474 start_codon:yes stop_codon:yes gene_type:complete
MDIEHRDLIKNIRLRAFDLLALREHSKQELVAKLGRKFHDRELISELLDELEAAELQSDERYAEMFLRQRIRKGHGPKRIKVDLDNKGIDPELSNMLLNSEGIDWRQLVLTVLQRKFGEKRNLSKAEMARTGRFLIQRGFSAEQIYQAIRDYNNFVQ